MDNCFNCNHSVNKNDKYCRNCGAEIKSDFYYITINVLTIIVFIIIILLIIMFAASYLSY